MTRPRPSWGQAPAEDPGRVDRLLAAVIALVEKDPALAARLHQAADVDGSPVTLHHTLGGTALQAAPGNHDHPRIAVLESQLALLLSNMPAAWIAQGGGSTTQLLLADPETKDSALVGNAGSDVAFDAVSGTYYLIQYGVRAVASVAAPVTVDIRVRDSGSTGSAPTNTSDLIVAGSVALDSTGGPGATTLTAWRTVACYPGAVAPDLVPGGHRLGGFFDVTAAAAGGKGGLDVNSGTGMVRELRVSYSHL